MKKLSLARTLLGADGECQSKGGVFVAPPGLTELPEVSLSDINEGWGGCSWSRIVTCVTL
eukprot:1171240-Amphidinium_carterae.1